MKRHVLRTCLQVETGLNLHTCIAYMFPACLHVRTGMAGMRYVYAIPVHTCKHG